MARDSRPKNLMRPGRAGFLALESKSRQVTILVLVLIAAVAIIPQAVLADRPGFLPAAEITGFSAWRPYNNPNQLVSIGMNKGEVLAIAGKPDHEESYYQGGGRLLRISDWYYVRSGHDPETTLLKFAQESLVSITTTPAPR